MYHIRKTKTASGSTAIQVARYANRKLIIAKHIGSGRTEDELNILKHMATEWIEQKIKQRSLFTFAGKHPKNERTILFDKYEYLGIRYAFIYEILHQLLERFEFTALGNALINDLAIMRLIEPASKSQSIELLKEYFGIYHRRQTFYETLPAMIKLKDEIERLTVKRAMEELAFDFSLVFYDVTTLYFESFEPDNLRKCGFSKDNKFQQPQIVIGLMVNQEGFPVACETFPGNEFEGHTLIPVIENFKTKHRITKLTVVADAAMISMDNIQALKKHHLNYIVGARLGNSSLKIIKKASRTLHKQDGAIARTTTLYGDLIYDFSAKRYRKGKYEMEKQIKKAEEMLQNQAKRKRIKFLKNSSRADYELNTELIEKSKLLLGIKGYYTNLEKTISDRAIIDHYHNLWRIEQAFRIAKNDLEMRPIFHFKEESIKVHVLICFMALAISKYMEIKTATSTAQIIKSFKRVTDARLLNTLTGKEVALRIKIPPDVKRLLQQLNLPY